jgi:ADP-heptose:LPS heptosyltransferase
MPNAKTFPHWPRLIELLQGEKIIQLGVEGEEPLVEDFRKALPLKVIAELVRQSDYWIAIDSFLPHLAQHVGTSGVVIWSASDPNIFGYDSNLNLLKDRKYLRKRQFGIWEEQSFVADAFLSAEEVHEQIVRWRAARRESKVA